MTLTEFVPHILTNMASAFKANPLRAAPKAHTFADEPRRDVSHLLRQAVDVEKRRYAFNRDAAQFKPHVPNVDGRAPKAEDLQKAREYIELLMETWIRPTIAMLSTVHVPSEIMQEYNRYFKELRDYTNMTEANLPHLTCALPHNEIQLMLVHIATIRCQDELCHWTDNPQYLIDLGSLLSLNHTMKCTAYADPYGQFTH